MPGYTDTQRTEKLGKVKHALTMGATIELACDYAEISRATLYLWKKKYPEWEKAVDTSQAKFGVNCLEKINHAAETTWQAAAWLLERRYPNDYGKEVRRVEGTLSVVELPSTEKQEWSPPKSKK